MEKNINIGEIINGIFVLGETDNGFAYKNSFEFNNKSDEVCYIPELNEGIEDYYRYRDFLRIAKESIEETGSTITPEKLAEHIFFTCEWEFPETIALDWERDDD